MQRTIEENKKLIEKYPFLAMKISPEYNNELTGDDIYLSTWFDYIPIGWQKAFGIQMCDELLEILKEGNYVNDYVILQIKEKFGFLRWYCNGIPTDISDKYRKWNDKYEMLSEKTCIKCGNPATHMTKGWIMPVCDECDKK